MSDVWSYLRSKNRIGVPEAKCKQETQRQSDSKVSGDEFETQSGQTEYLSEEMVQRGKKPTRVRDRNITSRRG